MERLGLLARRPSAFLRPEDFASRSGEASWRYRCARGPLAQARQGGRREVGVSSLGCPGRPGPKQSPTGLRVRGVSAFAAAASAFVLFLGSGTASATTIGRAGEIGR